MPATDDGTSGSTDPDGERVLAALGDDDCRAILGAVAESARSATAVAAACDLPLSTTYRKLDRLETAGLLVERTQFDPDHNHHSVYATAAADVNVAVDADGSLRVTVSYRDDREARTCTVAV